MKPKFEIGQKVYMVIDTQEVEIVEIYLTKDGVFYKINTGGRNITVGEKELVGSYKDAQREYVLMIQQLKDKCSVLLADAEAMGITIETEKK